jgi:hypothetical protein
MRDWTYVRGAIVAASFLGGVSGTPRAIEVGFSLLQVAAAVFSFGVVGMLFVIGIQAFNSRSDAVWSYPSWSLTPFSLRQPLQLFHLGGYFMLAAGFGGLLRSAVTHDSPLVEPIVLAFWGAGMLTGIWCCTRLFSHKLQRI